MPFLLTDLQWEHQLREKGKEGVNGLLTLDVGCQLGWSWLLKGHWSCRLRTIQNIYPFLRGTWPREESLHSTGKALGRPRWRGNEWWGRGAEGGRKKEGLKGIYQVWRETSFVSLWTSEGCVGRLGVGGTTDLPLFDSGPRSQPAGMEELPDPFLRWLHGWVSRRWRGLHLQPAEMRPGLSPTLVHMRISLRACTVCPWLIQ